MSKRDRAIAKIVDCAMTGTKLYLGLSDNHKIGCVYHYRAIDGITGKSRRPSILFYFKLPKGQVKHARNYSMLKGIRPISPDEAFEILNEKLGYLPGAKS